MNYKISIVIPTLNSSKTIKRCILSIINQTYKNWEVIIVDGSSKDKTLEIINKIKSKKIKVFKISNKKTISEARYFAVKKSTGNYIAFLDSDDTWTRTKLKYQIDIMKKKFNFVCTNFDLRKKDMTFKVQNKKNILSIEDLIYNRPIALSSVMIKKEIIIKAMKKNLKINYAEDFYWWTEILKMGHKCYLINKSLTQIYIHGDNRSVNFLKNYISLINIYKKNFEFSNLKILIIFIFLFFNTFSKNFFKFKNYI